VPTGSRQGRGAASCGLVFEGPESGLTAMAERAEELGGKLHLSSSPVSGTSVEFFMPKRGALYD
jgi:signal transduction histidine kinase